MFVDRFKGQWRLLLRALLSGAHGARRALWVFHKQQRANSDTSLDHFIQVLCEDELICLAPEKQPLALTKPLVCLFPTLFKQNLLAFVYHLHHVLSQSTVRHLLDCVKQDFLTNSWVTSLVTQLERQLGIDEEKPLFSAQFGQRLAQLLHPVPSCDEARGWATCFRSVPSSAPQSGSTLPGAASQRKRKSSDVIQGSDGEEISQQNKRMRVDLCVVEDVGTEQELSQEKEHPAPNASSEGQDPPPYMPRDTLPEKMMVAVLQLKDLLESNSEWDQSSSDVVNVLNDCDPAQLEVVCSTINLPNVPEHILPKLCSSVLALSPDLSFSTATIFIRSLLLQKILSLSEPASRCLVTTVTSLCSRYSRPLCQALFEPVLEDKNIGNLQADLLSKLFDVCLDSRYKRLALEMTFKVQWTEAVLSIIHSLLDSKLDIDEDLFTQFTEQLISKASQFTKSVKFAKMLLTVLTKYSSSITAVHKHTLSNCLMLNDTFLKKSLQAALKRITHI
ncbi:Fanconi anemia group E protein [Eucyclogobius newberryi]|uniref:Fanconi anemia group E protein n=1 Tax=Eucyclogobius newberryi TaxID=166745 RepID=UPI003B5AB738